MTIRWNDLDAGAWQPDCLNEDGYLCFRAPVPAGEKYTMTVVYPNDAFGFSADRQAGGGEEGGGEAGGSRKRKYAASLIKLLKITTEY